MSIEQRPDSHPESLVLRTTVSVLVTLLFIGLVLVGAIAAMTPVGQTLSMDLNWLFAANSVQLWWYVTRASGIMAYLLLWFSMVLGLAVTSKFLDQMLDRVFTYDFHQFISLLSIAFLLLHVIVLTFDRFLPYSVLQILVPFISPYRPFWVGVGVIAFYITLLVTVTFYIRSRIGTRTFRVIHILSLLGYAGATLHGFYAGTDTPLPAMQVLYKGSALVVIFFTVYWLAMLILRKQEARYQAVLAAQLAHKRHVPADGR